MIKRYSFATLVCCSYNLYILYIPSKTFFDELTVNNSIGYSIYHLNSDHRRFENEHGMVPISGPDSQLIWIGFSEEGNPYCYDSNGYLYCKYMKGVWTPISYLRHSLSHKSDNYWMVGVSERNQFIKAILCRGIKYPNVMPRPNMTTINMQIPLCDPESEKSKLEQDYWRNTNLAVNIKVCG